MYSTVLEFFALPTQSPLPQNLCQGDFSSVQFMQIVFPGLESLT